MDRLIKRWDGTRDGDLVLCEAHGVAYQRDMGAGRVPYDHAYYDKVAAYESGAIARRVNEGRVKLLARHLRPGANLIDVGAGNGAFVRAARAAGFSAFGFEVLLAAIGELQRAGAWADNITGFEAATFWDVLEHLDDPGTRINAVKRGALLFVSVPIFDDLRKIRGSKHYRPGEHLYYWTSEGFVAWAALYGFKLLEASAHEVEAGREQIGAFAFARTLPDYTDYIGFYDQMHSSRYYGGSATELHLETIARVVRDLNPASIIDYGCGRSDLAAHFWLDGQRRIARYDPAIPDWKDLPAGKFDLALCTDVLEHIPMAGLDRFLTELRAKSDNAVFTISTKLARAKLPNGSNAHVTLLTQGEWARWLAEMFGAAAQLPTAWEHELLFVAGPGVRRPPSFRPCPGCGGELYADSWVPLRKQIKAIGGGGGSRQEFPAEEWVMRCARCGATLGLDAGAALTRAQIEAAWKAEEVPCAPVS